MKGAGVGATSGEDGSMDRIVRLDDWCYDRAHDLVVLWVRLLRLHSEVLVTGVVAGNFLLNMLYLARFRDPTTGMGLIVAVTLYFAPRGWRVSAWPLPILRVLLAFVATPLALGHLAGAAFLGGDPGKESIWFLGALTYGVGQYLVMVPPLEPPPGQERRVVALGDGRA